MINRHALAVSGLMMVRPGTAPRISTMSVGTELVMSREVRPASQRPAVKGLSAVERDGLLSRV